MKRCNDCGRLSPEGALFCGTCRATFGVKLCPMRHLNPVGVTFCVQCGSEELTRPHRNPYRKDRIMAYAAGLFLAFLSVLFIAHSIAISMIKHLNPPMPS
jgi:hypothetical protein